MTDWSQESCPHLLKAPVSSTGSSPLRTPSTPSAPPPLAPPPSQEAPLDGREPSSFFTSWSRKKNRSPSTQVSGEPLSSEQTCRLQQDNQRLAEEVKAQKVGIHPLTPDP